MHSIYQELLIYQSLLIAVAILVKLQHYSG